MLGTRRWWGGGSGIDHFSTVVICFTEPFRLPGASNFEFKNPKQPWLADLPSCWDCRRSPLTREVMIIIKVQSVFCWWLKYKKRHLQLDFCSSGFPGATQFLKIFLSPCFISLENRIIINSFGSERRGEHAKHRGCRAASSPCWVLVRGFVVWNADADSPLSLQKHHSGST